MNKHLQPLILSEVEVRVLVNSLSLTVRQVSYLNVESLFVSLRKLRLSRVLLPSDSRRQDVVNRHSVVVLLDIHGADSHFSRLAAGRERLLVYSPFAPYEVETSETHHDRHLEVSQEHAHETDRRKVGYSAHTSLIVVNRNTELVPRNRLRRIVAQFNGCFTLVHDIVLTHDEILWTNANMILEILLIFVQCVVLIDILYIRSRLIRRVVALASRVAVRRVTLRVVDALVALQNRSAGIVEIRTTEIVIVVISRVGHDCLEGRTGNTSLCGSEELLIRAECLLLLVGKSVEAHILFSPCSR